jgi:ubiquinone/menaquinone biosynthesis C-methylase UbiE
MSYQRRQGSDPTLHLLNLTANDIVIDIGCGPGTDLATMARTARSAVGVDCSRSMVEAAAASAVAVSVSPEVLVADGQQLPFADGSFTAANCRAVLIHTPDPHTSVREIARPDRVANV